MSDVFGGAVVEVIDGQSVQFPRLTMSDYETLANAVKAAMRERIRALVNECALKGAERFVALRDGDPRFVTMEMVDLYLTTPDGAREALKMSLGKAGVGDAADGTIAKLPMLRASELAREIVGFLQPKEVANAGG